MHRFRKRSDARRPQGFGTTTEFALAVHTETQDDALPSLPPASDFRTSLILPDLTRRFSVLRNSSGEPIRLDELKSKFAQQRARGSQHQVSEEEEDMILEALGRFHARSRSKTNQDPFADGDGQANPADGEDDHADPIRLSVRPSESTTSPSLHGASSMASISSTKGSLSSRRMSNNLFGSGKFRDQAYFLRTTNPRRGGRAAGPIAQSESNTSMSTVESSRGENSTSIYSDNHSLRPTTPEGSMYTFSGSAPSSPGNASTMSKDRSSRSILGDQSDYSSTLSRRLSKALSPDGLKRASLALDQAIRELEEEGDDEIVMERSPIAHVPPSILNGSLSALNTAVESDSSPAVSPAEFETGTALSSDDHVTPDDAKRSSPYPGSRTTSPTPRLPGYIPGMPRPMTPRETTFDTEDLTPSATPRATSPRLPGLNTQGPSLMSQSLTSSMYRSNSSASSHATNRPNSPATGTTPPLFFNRSMNGRYTPEERQRNGSKSSSPTSDTAESPILGRRRPISPLSGPAYQPLTSSPSRPTTPSNVTWNMPTSNGTSQKTHGRNGSVASRNGSTASINDQNIEQLERSKSATRSLRSPALPDSPWVDGSNSTVGIEYRPPSAMSGMDLGAPAQAAHTPNGSRSPTFTDVGGVDEGRITSRRSSKQTPHTSLNTFSFSQPNALLFSPLANSSRSSLESAGSSYHTWDEDHKNDRLFGLFSSLDPDSSPWHDISPDKSAPSTAGTSPYEATETEDVVRREVGLSKGDFVAIQDKLVGAALTKAATPENRRPGSIRRRRPSTSQSNYSFNGDSRAVNSTPQPQSHSQSQPQPVATSSRGATSEQVARANALLNAVVDSIESPRARPPAALPAEESTLVVPSVSDIEQSSPMRRNRALAEALFGSEDWDTSSAVPPQISIMPEMSSSGDDETPARPVLTPIKPLSTKRSDSMHRVAQPSAPTSPPVRTMPTSPTMPLSPTSMPLPMSPIGMPMSPIGMPTSPLMMPTSPGLLSPLSPSSNIDPISLALEVQRRAEAATAALHKSPSIPKISEGNGGTLPRKRISPNKISAPTLVSASTSVDAIPLRSPTATPTPTPTQQQQTNKIGSRFKKLRGTIRTKHSAPSGEEITPYPLDLRSVGSEATGSSSPSLALRSEPIAIHSAGTAEPSRFKAPAPLPSPPASAAPGLKGFMARFRKQRAAPEAPATPQSHVSHQPSSQSASATSARSTTSSGSSAEPAYSQVPHSAPALQMFFRSPSPTGPPVPAQSPTPKPQDYLGLHMRPQSQPSSDEDAIKQLFHAAENLGLDQAALNELLARSPSTSSRSTAWTQLTRATSPNNSRKSQVPVIRGRATPDSVRSPISEGRPSVDGYSPRPSADIKPPGRKSQDAAPALHLRQQQQSQQDATPNAIVRRTIIFPSDSRMSTLDLQAMMRKQSVSRRRTSVSSKNSVHDRVPTPPPPHHRAAGRRFSTDASPPVPQLPPALSAQNDSFLAVPSPVEKVGSAYDSLYEMYSGDGRGLSTTESPGGGSSQVHDGIPESGPALEVIELANGETIWSIVNGLRDDDGESFYNDRASFYSEYSVKDDNVKLFFKEHERKNSKGSVNSFLSRKKSVQQPVQPKGTARPETKVFFSSSAQIGRLIENLSRGTDAGSFNIMPGHGQGQPRQPHLGHSTTSSLGSETDMRWTVEERLEHMLGSMGAS